MEPALSLPFSGSKLRNCRERAGYTRPGLAKKCADLGRPITPMHIGRLERDFCPPRPTTLKSLALALEVDIDDLLDDTRPAA